MHDIELNIRVQIIDMDDFAHYALDYGCSTEDDIVTMVRRVVISPDKAPLDVGYEIASCEVESGTPRNQTIIVGINVLNEELMVKEAMERFEACWPGEDWRPETLGQAAFEILCASNDQPSPDDLSFQYVKMSYPKDREIDVKYWRTPGTEPEVEKVAAYAI